MKTLDIPNYTVVSNVLEKPKNLGSGARVIANVPFKGPVETGGYSYPGYRFYSYPVDEKSKDVLVKIEKATKARFSYVLTEWSDPSSAYDPMNMGWSLVRVTFQGEEAFTYMPRTYAQGINAATQSWDLLSGKNDWFLATHFRDGRYIGPSESYQEIVIKAGMEVKSWGRLRHVHKSITAEGLSTMDGLYRIGHLTLSNCPDLKSLASVREVDNLHIAHCPNLYSASRLEHVNFLKLEHTPLFHVRGQHVKGLVRVMCGDGRIEVVEMEQYLEEMGRLSRMRVEHVMENLNHSWTTARAIMDITLKRGKPLRTPSDIEGDVRPLEFGSGAAYT